MIPRPLQLTVVRTHTAFRLVVPTTEDLAWYLAHRAIPQHPDGFTFSVPLWQFPTFGPAIYLVSLRGYEAQFTQNPTEVELSAWLSSVAGLLKQPAHFVGGWREPKTQRFYLDITVCQRGHAAALQCGREHHQKAIYHPATNSSILVVPENKPHPLNYRSA